MQRGANIVQGLHSLGIDTSVDQFHGAWLIADLARQKVQVANPRTFRERYLHGKHLTGIESMNRTGI